MEQNKRSSNREDFCSHIEAYMCVLFLKYGINLWACQVICKFIFMHRYYSTKLPVSDQH